MNEAEHLTDKQIAGYYSGAFAEAETHKIGRHLLFCAACRTNLPAQTAEGFLSALMDEREAAAEISTSEKAKFLLPVFPIVSAFFAAPSRTLAWGGAALVVLFGLSFLIWFGATRQSSAGDGELAQTFETGFESERKEIAEQITSLPIQTLENDKSVSSIDSNDSNRAAKPISVKSGSPKDGQYSQKFADKTPKRIAAAPGDKKEIVSLTRGGASSAPKCGDEAATAVMTIGAAGDGAVTLKWKRVPKAAQYHLYVSDDEEILLDEFQTAETSYVLKKPLDPLKTYKWKVIVTLESGETIVGNTQRFTVKDLESNQKKSAKKEKSEIRCSQYK